MREIVVPGLAESPVDPGLSIELQRQNAQHIVQTAGHIAQALRGQIESRSQADDAFSVRQVENFFESVENGTYNRQYTLGEPGVWLQETTWAIAQGHNVVVEFPHVSMHTYAERGKHLVEPPDDSFNDLTCSIGGIVRAIRPPHHRTTMAYPIYDQIDPATGRRFNERALLQFQSDVDDYLHAKGAVYADDKQGRDYSIVSNVRSEQFLHRKLVPLLGKSTWGSVHKSPYGSVAFTPKPELLDMTPVPLTDKEKERYLEHGAFLQIYGETTSSALRVAGAAWNCAARNAVRLNITPYSARKDTNETYMIARALGLTQLERYHALRLPYPTATPQEPQYALSRRVEKYAKRFEQSFDLYNQFDDFDPVEYAWRNYGKEMLDDDKNLCLLTMFTLEQLGVSNARTADIGCGPNLYPAMLLEPYSRTIDLLEYSPRNREFLDSWFRNKLPADQQNIFNKFGLLMLGAGGAKYHDVIKRLKQQHQDGRLQVAFGDNFDLPEQRWDVITNSFVGDSITFQKFVFPDTVRPMRDALAQEGVLISIYMLNDPKHAGYPAGQGKLFPNISQTTGEIKNVYIDNGMVCAVIPTQGPDKARAGYSGMAYVVAAHQGSEMADKVRALTRPLHEFAAAGFGLTS